MVMTKHSLRNMSPNISDIRRLQHFVALELQHVGDSLADAGVAQMADVEVLVCVGLRVLHHDALACRRAFAVIARQHLTHDLL